MILFRLTKSNRLTIPYLLSQLEKVNIPAKNVVLCESFSRLIDMIKVSTFNHSRIKIFYSFMTPHIREVWNEIRELKRLYPEITAVAGGPHVSGDPYSGLKMGFDAVVCGEMDEGFGELVLRLDDELSGSQGKIYITRPQLSLDHVFPFNPYFNFFPPLEISRGCRWNCKFCQTATRSLIHRHISSTLYYLKELKNRNIFNRISFICPSASEYGTNKSTEINFDWLHQIFEYAVANNATFIEYGIFPSETRPNKISSEFLDLIAPYVTNKKITVGAQSGSDELLKKIRRAHSTADIIAAADLIHAHGFKPVLDFIIGFPGETKEHRLETFQLIKNLNKQFGARIQMHYFLPLSGTDLADNIPTLLDSESKQLLYEFYQGGVVTNWWETGMKSSWEIVDTMKMLSEVSLCNVEESIL
ncbi:MAG: TIGR04013 family B12-binding domain/radical SAM domain-containing protein [Calditrichia bacterium]